jgi:DNA-binding transcriptional LysR family regulator
MFLADLSQFSIQSLRVFIYVASMGSVVRAADALRLTQPAVSLQIANLEKQIGFSLFEKQGRRNVLTAKGQLLYRKLMPQLETLEAILLDVRESGSTRPELYLGSVEGIGEYWLGSRVRDFSKSHQGMRFNLEIVDTEKLERRLLTGRVAIAITPRKIENPQVVSQVLMDESLLPVGTKDRIAELKKVLESAKPESNDRPWEKMEWVGYGTSNSPDPWALRWLESVGFLVDRRFRYHHHVNSYSLIKQLLLEGRGICVAPEHVIEAELKSGTLSRYESKKHPPLKNRMYVSYRESSLNALHQDFVQWLIKTAGTQTKALAKI